MHYSTIYQKTLISLRLVSSFPPLLRFIAAAAPFFAFDHLAYLVPSFDVFFSRSLRAQNPPPTKSPFTAHARE